PLFSMHTSPTLISSLSLHDALPISAKRWAPSDIGCAKKSARKSVRKSTRKKKSPSAAPPPADLFPKNAALQSQASDSGAAFACPDRKSTRLNSSHVSISYAVFCLKK